MQRIHSHDSYEFPIRFKLKNSKCKDIDSNLARILEIMIGEEGGVREREAWAKNHETGWKANGHGATSAASLYWSKWYRHKGTRGSFVNSILTSGVCRRQLLFRRNKLPRTAAALCHALSTRPALHDRYFNAPSPTLSMRVFQFRSFYSCERSSPLKSSVKTCVSRFFFLFRSIAL